jgi:hypothetical protein
MKGPVSDTIQYVRNDNALLRQSLKVARERLHQQYHVVGVKQNFIAQQSTLLAQSLAYQSKLTEQLKTRDLATKRQERRIRQLSSALATLRYEFNHAVGLPASSELMQRSEPTVTRRSTKVRPQFRSAPAVLDKISALKRPVPKPRTIVPNLRTPTIVAQQCYSSATDQPCSSNANSLNPPTNRIRHIPRTVTPARNPDTTDTFAEQRKAYRDFYKRPPVPPAFQAKMDRCAAAEAAVRARSLAEYHALMARNALRTDREPQQPAVVPAAKKKTGFSRLLEKLVL